MRYTRRQEIRLYFMATARSFVSANTQALLQRLTIYCGIFRQELKSSSVSQKCDRNTPETMTSRSSPSNTHINMYVILCDYL